VDYAVDSAAGVCEMMSC